MTTSHNVDSKSSIVLALVRMQCVLAVRDILSLHVVA